MTIAATRIVRMPPNPIDDAVSETFGCDIFPPDSGPIEEVQMVNGRPESFYRRRDWNDCRLARMNLYVEHIDLDVMDDAYENAADALGGLAKRISAAAARVRCLRKAVAR